MHEDGAHNQLSEAGGASEAAFAPLTLSAASSSAAGGFVSNDGNGKVFEFWVGFSCNSGSWDGIDSSRKTCDLDDVAGFWSLWKAVDLDQSCLVAICLHARQFLRCH